MSLLTIIITASYIKSHPSIDFIKKCIESLDNVCASKDTKIILAHDFHEHENYKNYLNNLHDYIADKPFLQIATRDTFGCLTGNIRNAFQFVDTPYVLIVQHDLVFIKKFDIYKIIEDMKENNNLKHIRFNKRSNIKINSDSINELFGKQVQSTNYIYTRTPSWSDNNHLCSSDYYRNIILNECKDGSFMEKTLIRRSINESIHNIYGTYLFGPLDETAYIIHTDGKNKSRIVGLN